MFHAWYSPQAAQRYGTVIYAREDGSEVEVTTADYDYDSDYTWPDKQYRGLVSRYLRIGRTGSEPLISFHSKFKKKLKNNRP